MSTRRTPSRAAANRAAWVAHRAPGPFGDLGPVSEQLHELRLLRAPNEPEVDSVAPLAALRQLRRLRLARPRGLALGRAGEVDGDGEIRAVAEGGRDGHRVEHAPIDQVHVPVTERGEKQG